MGAAGRRRSYPAERLAERIAAIGDLFAQRDQHRPGRFRETTDEPPLGRRPALGVARETRGRSDQVRFGRECTQPFLAPSPLVL